MRVDDVAGTHGRPGPHLLELADVRQLEVPVLGLNPGPKQMLLAAS